MLAGLEGRDSFGCVNIQQQHQQVNKLKSIVEFVRGCAIIHLDLETGYFQREKQCETQVLSRKKKRNTYINQVTQRLKLRISDVLHRLCTGA